MFLCSTIFKVQIPSLKFFQMVFIPIQKFILIFFQCKFLSTTILQNYSTHI
jgi:hypothetical protein